MIGHGSCSKLLRADDMNIIWWHTISIFQHWSIDRYAKDQIKDWGQWIQLPQMLSQTQPTRFKFLGGYEVSKARQYCSDYFFFAGKVLSSQKVLITSPTHKSEDLPVSIRRRSSPLHAESSSTSASLVKALQACMSTWSFGDFLQFKS